MGGTRAKLMSGTHAKLSPSGASRWANCPGAPAAEAPYPDDASEYAAEGTVAHDIAAQCLTSDRQPQDFVGRVIEADGFDIEVTRDMAHFVETYIDQVRTANRSAAATLVEVRVPIGHITGEDGATGTSDFVGIELDGCNATVRVHDLKYGQGVRVEAENNLQLAMYALGVVEHLDYLLEGCSVDLELCIHQVRLDHLPTWYVSLDELREYESMLRTAAAACTEDAPRIPGETQCRFCKHRRACPELRAMIESTIADDPPRDADAVAEVLPRLKLIRDWCATVEARGVELLEQGYDVPGWKLVEGRGSRAWGADTARVERSLRYRTGLKKKDLYEEKLVSVTQAEKLVPKGQWSRISKLVEKRAGKPTLAPETDKRPAVNVAESMGFDDLSEEQTA